MDISINLTINSEVYTPHETEIIRSQCRKTKDKSQVIWDKVIDNNELVLHIRPEDTEFLDPNEQYVYDIQLETATGDVYTIVPKSPLILFDDVTTRRVY
jgi:hypothetical protein